ncbi:hypothetical protein [Microbacterium imperiale]|uniref:Uncharacterized protein n=1 Tax=Microbacterium imperiale TaxID=33884 RepID=A0A9W6M2I4_9MICO|nr:hypothetical protein [Microbacterium imperiale]MBP2419664.1 hypothetical protein [Microbacterium imperiale]MDS0198470.1 hypothetical protein [Microbacterium imperiale]BFE40005.1 hypothetical protein GCM10017544_09610 [Microbacterium imperiale]GLJ79020.1 hypothetical protein GCM10017586_07020 [Microbacterium imperiale]
MADARIPERYLVDRRIMRLSDAERSSLFLATLWSVSNRTDGRIERGDLAIIPMFREAAVHTLVVQGLWVEDGPDAWVIVDYERDQTSRSQFEVMENTRRREREKKQRQRLKQGVPGDSPGGQSRGTSQDRQGQARQGEEGQEIAEGVDVGTGEVHEWPVRVPGEQFVQDEVPW